MIFEGSFFGGTQNIWGNPYLNSTTILFDMHSLHAKVMESISLNILTKE